MRLELRSDVGLFACVALALSGCSGMQNFDVPLDSAGQPTVASIVARVKCELLEMVRDDKGDDHVPSFHRAFLLNGDYDVAASLSLDVTDSGGLAPSLTYLNAFSAGHSVSWGASFNASRERVANFTENLSFSLRDIYTDWKIGGLPMACPVADTNLAGDLGIRNIVAMAALSEGGTPGGANKPAFSGSVQFAVTKAMTAAGPTWTLSHFKGPGSLASLSEKNLDKITLAFAQGPDAGKPMSLAREPKRASRTTNPVAAALLQQVLTSSINTQLQSLTTPR
jgi:hypothetical protein